jgi:hypothetical protein
MDGFEGGWNLAFWSEGMNVRWIGKTRESIEGEWT